MKSTRQHSPIERWFRALADPVRLRILCLLTRGEQCVCDLVDLLDVPQPTASRHLAYLRRVGLVESRQKGAWRWYRLSDAASGVHQALRECLAVCCDEHPAVQADLQRQQRQCNEACCPTTPAGSADNSGTSETARKS